MYVVALLVGIPDRVAVPFRLSTSDRPVGKVPDSEMFGVVMNPEFEMLYEPLTPFTKVTGDVIEIAGATGVGATTSVNA